MDGQAGGAAAGGVTEPMAGHVTATARAAPVPQRRGGVLAWALYDYARTIFSYSILAVNFSLWVTQDHRAPVIVFTLAASLSLAIIAVTSPALGAISDAAGRRLPFLAVVTALMVVPTALLAFTTELWVGLALFVVANVGYQSTQVFYDSLLGSVATPARRGRISGMGMAFGYLGTISWGVLSYSYLSHYMTRTSHAADFLPTAIAVAVFALPCLLSVREQRPPRRTPVSRAMLKMAFTQTRRSVRKVRRDYPNLAAFLLARLLYADAANTVVSFMAVYAVVVVRLTDRELNIFLPSAATFALLGALLFGNMADRFGPKRMLNIVLALWFVAMVWAALVPTKGLFYAVGPLAGLALGGTRACDRIFLVRLAPRAMVGEAFGLFSLVGDVASIAGPLILGIVTYAFLRAGHEILGYRAAILAIVALLCLGWWLLQRVSDGVGERA